MSRADDVTRTTTTDATGSPVNENAPDATLRREIVMTLDTPHSFRVSQIASLYDVPLDEQIAHRWQVDLSELTTRPWRIGLIVGPSASGKSTIARTLWPDAYTTGYTWTPNQSLLDDFPATLTGKEIVSALVSVGFSSPPAWVKPYAALSTGEQMRANLARALASLHASSASDDQADAPEPLVVFDEFTSVVDRTVAQIGSAALSSAVRATNHGRFIAVTCHADVEAWLAPDWVYAPHTNTLHWRSLQRGSHRHEQRPPISLAIEKLRPAAVPDWWRLFAPHHYLSASLNTRAQCYLAWWERDEQAGQTRVPVAFVALLPIMGYAHAWRLSRSVVLPDYQGVGIGGAVTDALAAYYTAQGNRVRATASHPALIAHRNASPHWGLSRLSPYGYPSHKSGMKEYIRTTSFGRPVATFEYVGDGGRLGSDTDRQGIAP